MYYRRSFVAGGGLISYGYDLVQQFRDTASITSSAHASSDGGTVRPSALAVLRLMTKRNLVGDRWRTCRQETFRLVVPLPDLSACSKFPSGRGCYHRAIVSRVRQRHWHYEPAERH